MRGWSLLACGTGTLVLAWLLGRRELLNVAVFLVAAPLVAAAALRVGLPRLQVRRSFTAHHATANRATAGRECTVVVEIAPPAAGIGQGPAPGAAQQSSRGPLRLTETLPAGAGPSPSAIVSVPGTFRYGLRPPRRGLYAVGPLTVESTDPFGLARRTVALGGPSPLTVLGPLPRVETGPLPGLRGGTDATAFRGAASADSDDAATREYRDGDPMRRVHWGTTARRGRLMVRQEQPRTPRRATVVVDRSAAAFVRGSAASGHAPSDRPEPVGHFPSVPGTTTACFDWAVAAAAGIGASLARLGYAVELLDRHGDPLAASSPTASDPARAVFEGAGAVDELRCVLAALGLEAEAEQPAGSGRGAGGSGPDWSGSDRIASGRYGSARYGMGSPVVLLTGRLDEAGARAWVDSLGPDRAVSVLLASGLPEESASAVRVFRENGWRAAAAAPNVPLEQAWLALDTWSPLPPSPRPTAPSHVPTPRHPTPPPRPTTPPRPRDGAHPGQAP
ncbi:DUF58 domain-containing protein [Arthrobacter ginkgonis]